MLVPLKNSLWSASDLEKLEEITTYNLPIKIRKMLNIFQSIYKTPQTNGVVFEVKENYFMFNDLNNDFLWKLYENKIEKISLENQSMNTFTFANNCFLEN